jgi:hypothetical protein
MTLKITKGKRTVPVRGVLYGTAGIGKSTFGAGLPRPLFLDTEESTNQLDVDRVLVTSWAALGAAVAELASGSHDYQTVVIDTADWAERLLVESILAKHNQKSIEGFGYGKGYTILAEEFGRFLTLCDGLISKGIHVFFIAHAKVVRQSPPDQTDGFDRYELKLSKQVAPLLKEWSDMLLFANFEIQVVEGTDGKIKAQGGKERVMHTTNHAAWDAKNRYGLAETLPFDPAQIAGVFAGTFTPAPVNTPAPAEEAPVKQAAINAEQLAKLTTYVQNSVCAPIIAKALDHFGEASVDLLTEEQAGKVIARCQEEMNKPAEKKAAPAQPLASETSPKFPWPATEAAWLTEHEQTVNAYLVQVKWIQPGQTFRDIAPDRGEKIVINLPRFARAANIPAPSEGKAAA